MENLEHLDGDYDRAEFLQSTLIKHDANGDNGGSEQDYISLRVYFLGNPDTKDLIPKWIRVNRDLRQFWHFIKHKFSTYADRRAFIWEELNPLLEYCETQQTFPADQSITEVLKNFDEAGINDAWKKALERSSSDPEGAITIARTILESVCIYILDSESIEYAANKIELQDLYKKTSKQLNLSPSQHSEEIFRQILGGCSGIVNGLGSLRNRLGDAHGKGKAPVRPAPRHAELAVNLSGSMSLFLLETYNAQAN